MKSLVVKTAGKLKASPLNSLEGMKILFDTYQKNHEVNEVEKTKRKNIEAMKETELKKITSQKELITKVIDFEYSERDKNFDNLFKVLDKTLELDNNEIIKSVLNTIENIAKTPPKLNAKKFLNDYNDSSDK